MTFRLALMTTWLEPAHVWKIASAFWAFSVEFLRLRTEDRYSWVAGATQPQFRAHCVYMGELSVNISLHWDIEVGLRISN